MTKREIEILRGLLQALHEQDRRQMSETQLHCAVNAALAERGRVAATLGEFCAVLGHADREGFATGVVGRFGGKKWNISDQGEAALMEL